MFLRPLFQIRQHLPHLPKPRNSKFNRAIAEIQTTHDKKNQDYATDENPYSNFELAAQIAGVEPIEVFKTLIGVKLARLVELEAKGKTPNFESIEDTWKDLAVYAAMGYSYQLQD